ncbi:type I-F CRISPR-associated helicase Cas3f [Nitrosomonas sp. Is37]|uniref:type I-F CRISPR-associated helicase Cas3f n=1 Tax=Nitrosomonas sp. Is37 TaxID=3080535 RepID=UPI00294AAB09|nr:type I-F CRISPR-associated helicase Cas3f [Nitrosomonas sp. Is37]MDV6343161.1 type I-F CRISPR-associated helicase Cas3f [Nitrosomonas sp. Is37]
MMVTFVSQCEKKALNRTRRVLDAFANRIGDRTWQTVITEDGLIAVKTLLRKTATKNTAVACHWIRSRSRSELIWIVGNRKRFNTDGIVPVNRTKIDLNHRQWEKGWHTTEVIAVASAIAGLFHDFGKANDLFQDKLNPEIKGKIFEPYRHEWISLRLFQALVGNLDDKQWLKMLANIDDSFERQVLERLVIDNPELIEFDNPLETLPHLAKLVAWLIVSHHRLPVYPKRGDNEPSVSNINNWPLIAFDPLWNSVNSVNSDWDDRTRQANWVFSKSTPLASKTWQQKASQISKRALRCLGLIGVDWFTQPFMMHLSRLALMLSDHNYSAMDTTPNWQDSSYFAYANTNDYKQFKQKLDEHNIGVAHHAYLFAKSLPRFRDELPNVSDDKKILSKGLSGEKVYQWQDKAYRVTREIQAAVQIQGFFGINMASTGKGKTIANARIMYGLANEEEGCRFSIALGLRALTLQTGKSLKERLQLDDDEIATLIGSQAFLRLSQSKLTDDNILSTRGSESLDMGLDDDGHEVIYDNHVYEGRLDKWFKNNPKAQKLLHAPILVSTIDHLTPATEGVRSGRQIVPMLRLLTSDLILDEPDELDLNDLPALARLVNWAGMLGARVVLSTATMPPALVYALFEAYEEGRKAFNAATLGTGAIKPIVCGWFDEFDAVTTEEQGIQSFITSHDNFVKNRITNLNHEALVLRKAKLLDVLPSTDLSPIECMAQAIRSNMLILHTEHHQQHKSGKKISIGLVRIANINPLVAIARYLFASPVQESFRIHCCVYHSQYPLAQRALIESKLDQILNRTDALAIWRVPEIEQALNNNSEQNQLFVVLATSVAEIGRDHDYDWAIAEPSSMRSIIQLAGRVQRHRKRSPNTENIYILAKNFRTLQGKEIAYEKPGFEAENRKLRSHDLHEILEVAQYSQPNAIPSIHCKVLTKEERKLPFTNLVTIEHIAYREILLGDNLQQNHARLWWKNQTSWCAELQRRQPFRKSSPDQAYCLYLDEENTVPVWQIKNEQVYPIEYAETSNITNIEISIAKGNQIWFEMDVTSQYEGLSDLFGRSLKYISYCFGEVRLPEYQNQVVEWCYSPLLGVFKEI